MTTTKEYEFLPQNSILILFRFKETYQLRLQGTVISISLFMQGGEHTKIELVKHHTLHSFLNTYFASFIVTCKHYDHKLIE